MLLWLGTLTIMERILLYVAVPATLLLMIQLVLLLIGLGGGDADADGSDADGGVDLHGGGIPDDASLGLDGGIPDDVSADADGVPDHADMGGAEGHDGFFAGLNVFTVRGVVTFLTLFGWSGLLFCQLGLHPLLALFLGVQVGVIGMVGVAVILREALRLQSDGTLDIRNALGLVGSVYLTVPGARKGAGKVNVTVQDQLREFEAVTEETEPIPTGADIQVVGITGGDTLVVIPVRLVEEQ